MPLNQEQLASLDKKNVDWRRLDYVEASEVLDAVSKPGAAIVDVRGASVHEEGHFPGAINANGKEKDQLLGLPKEQALYLYCT